MDSLELIIKLKNHLGHLTNIMQERTFLALTHAEKAKVIQDEIKVMLNYIDSWEKKIAKYLTSS